MPTEARRKSNMVKGTAFIKYNSDKTYEIFAKWGNQVSQLFKGQNYKYDDILEVLVINGMQLNFIEKLVFSY